MSQTSDASVPSSDASAPSSATSTCVWCNKKFEDNSVIRCRNCHLVHCLGYVDEECGEGQSFFQVNSGTGGSVIVWFCQNCSADRQNSHNFLQGRSPPALCAKETLIAVPRLIVKIVIISFVIVALIILESLKDMEMFILLHA